MSCKFEFKDYGDRNSLIDDLRKEVEAKGGVFEGDYDKGKFYGSDPIVYEVYYSFDINKTLKIKIRSSIPYPCFIVKRAINDYLKNRNIYLSNLVNREKKMIFNEMLHESMFIKVFGEILFEIPS